MLKFKPLKWTLGQACVCAQEIEREFTCCVEQTDIKTTLHAPNTTEVHMAPASSSASYTNSVNTNMHTSQLHFIDFTLLLNNLKSEIKLMIRFALLLFI